MWKSCIILTLICYATVDASSLYAGSDVAEVSAFPNKELCPWYAILHLPWCGGCIRLAPIAKEFAKTLENNTFGTIITAIDCGQYHDTCVSYNTTMFPAVFYYDGETLTKMDKPPRSISAFLPDAPKGLVLTDSTIQKTCTLQKLKLQNKTIDITQQKGVSRPSNIYISFHTALKKIPTSVQENVDQYNTQSGNRTVLTPEGLVLKAFLSHAYAAIPSLRSSHGPPGDPSCGYTCGLWRLFHTMVEGPEPIAALYSIRDYIITFFECAECGDHFASMSEYLNRQLSNRDSAALWLWRAHNKVNVRLGKPTFPSRNECVGCQTEQDIVLFLQTQYRAQNDTDKSAILTVAETGNVHFILAFFGVLLAIFLLMMVYTTSLRKDESNIELVSKSHNV